MKYVFSYDISSTESRKKLSDYLIMKGFNRIQKSVFIGELDSLEIEKIEEESEIFIDYKSDKILIFPICKKDQKRSNFDDEVSEIPISFRRELLI